MWTLEQKDEAVLERELEENSRLERAGYLLGLKGCCGAVVEQVNHPAFRDGFETGKRQRETAGQEPEEF